MYYEIFNLNGDAFLFIFIFPSEDAVEMEILNA